MIEQSFEPVAIYNNVGGADKKIINRFGEPAWNFQVVRFVDHKGKDVLPRRDGINTVPGIAARMIAALEEKKRAVPGELRALIKM